MNGRVYDPAIGRFLSADPIIQTLALSQAINPFSYVMNNPLALIDPSGYSWLSKLFHNIGHFLHKYWKPLLAIVVAYFAMPYISQLITQSVATSAAASTYAATGSYSIAFAAGETAAAVAAPWIGVVSGAIAGSLAGAISGGLKGAIVGGFAGALFSASSELWGGVNNTLGRDFGQTITSGSIGGATSEAYGGNFRDGFWFGFATSAAASAYEAIVKYGATWRAGKFVANKGEFGRPVEQANNFGTQGGNPDNPSFWQEGGPLSRVFNRIPGMNAIAGMHDEFQIQFSGIQRLVFNVPLMAPAVAITLPALLSTGTAQIAYDTTN